MDLNFFWGLDSISVGSAIGQNFCPWANFWILGSLKPNGPNPLSTAYFWSDLGAAQYPLLVLRSARGAEALRKRKCLTLRPPRVWRSWIQKGWKSISGGGQSARCFTLHRRRALLLGITLWQRVGHSPVQPNRELPLHSWTMWSLVYSSTSFELAKWKITFSTNTR